MRQLINKSIFTKRSPNFAREVDVLLKLLSCVQTRPSCDNIRSARARSSCTSFLEYFIADRRESYLRVINNQRYNKRGSNFLLFVSLPSSLCNRTWEIGRRDNAGI